MCNRDEQPSANTSFRCTYPGFTNKDYAQRYANSIFSFDREHDEIHQLHQNSDQMEEVKCIDGNQKRKSKTRKLRKKKVKRTIEQRIDAHAGLKNVASSAILMPSSNALQVLQCPPNEEHKHVQLYFEFTSVINSLVSGGDNVVNLKKLNTRYSGNKNFKQDKGKYHYNPMDK